MLHKELDADDGELTRTRKVRRGYVADKYSTLVDALYSDKDNVHIETEVTFEDGRKGSIEADIKISDMVTAGASALMAAVMEAHAVGDVVLKADDVTVTFGAVKALTGVSFDVKEREILAIIGGPKGAGKNHDAQRDQWVLSSG
ncbi:MAG: hypothetical protein CM1200mP39_29250 [Dehalococcoidia bacterium]|nr:MAG: hypothetical protein CM1200mP39_29250 [Dehalococcoidia bacterium]